MRKSLLALLLLTAGGLAQAQVLLKDGHPETYTVAKGDTLWDISGRFLSQPWKWTELWQSNPQIKNPDLIYPGDTLSLTYVNGQPRLSLNRGQFAGTIKLSPTVRSTPMAQAIPSIPLETINSFLFNNRIANDEKEFTSAPYVLAGAGESVVMGAGQSIYARGKFASQQPAYGVYRQGKTYTDPKTNEFLGINANIIGNADVVSVEGDITTLKLTRTNEEVRLGDRLFATDERAVNSNFSPSEPAMPIDGLIIDVPRGVSQIGSMDVVTINKGKRDGLVEGNVLAIIKTGETVHDRVTGESIKVPDSRGGLLMIFSTYDKISYGLVLVADRDLALQDKVVNP